MNRSLRILSALIIVGATLIMADVRPARAEVELALLEMRAAAEELAEIAPESAAETGRKPHLLPAVALPSTSRSAEALRAVARAAARAEVAREVDPHSSRRNAASAAGPGHGKGANRDNDNGPGNGSGDGPRDAAAQARSAAVQAQQARLNRNNEQRVNAPPMKGPMPRN